VQKYKKDRQLSCIILFLNIIIIIPLLLETMGKKITVNWCCRGYLATEKNILLLKIQNRNEYGIKIKYHRRYLMLILHTISQCIVCL
jgi:hypothetical protein